MREKKGKVLFRLHCQFMNVKDGRARKYAPDDHHANYHLEKNFKKMLRLRVKVE